MTSSRHHSAILTHQILIDQRDVTGQFEYKQSVEVTGRKGLRLLVHRSELRTRDFRPRREDNGLWLHCVASVRDMRPYVESVQLDVDCELMQMSFISLKKT